MMNLMTFSSSGGTVFYELVEISKEGVETRICKKKAIISAFVLE